MRLSEINFIGKAPCVLLLFFLFVFMPTTQAITLLPDTLATENKSNIKKINQLDAVTVKATTRKEISQGIAFFPTKQQKKFAHDAMSLLDQMDLPELPYNPFSKKVELPNGSAPAYFINGIKASPKDLSALYPKDVDRVEYLLSPSDANFEGATNVVNFITKIYISGGYTKINAEQQIHNLDGDYSAVSKFAHKHLTFDILAGGGYSASNHNGDIYQQDLKGINYNGESYDNIDILSNTGKSRQQSNKQSVLVRLMNNNTKKYKVVVNAGWNRSATPVNQQTVNTQYNPPLFDSHFYQTSSQQQAISPYFTAQFYTRMSHKQSLNIMFQPTYAYYNSGSVYSPENLADIANGYHSKEAGSFLSATYVKTFNPKNSININFWYSFHYINTDYSGSADFASAGRDHSVGLMLKYIHSFKSGTWITAEAGLVKEWNKVDGNFNSPAYPRINIVFRKRWNPISAMSITSKTQNVGFGLASKEDVIIRQSELFWLRANPDLRSRLYWTNTISNTWEFNSNFSLVANASVTSAFHDDAYFYFVEPGYDGLVKMKTDRINTHRINAGLTATWRLFNRRLTLSGNAFMNYNRTTGDYKKNYNGIYGWLRARWSGKGWNIGASFMPPNKSLYRTSLIREPFKMKIDAGVAAGNFNITASITNPFNGSHLSKRQWVSLPHYSEVLSSYAESASRCIHISVTYTVSYGKKVSQSDPYLPGIVDSSALKAY